MKYLLLNNEQEAPKEESDKLETGKNVSSQVNEWRDSLVAIARVIQGFNLNDATVTPITTFGNTDDANGNILYLQSLVNKKRKQNKQLNTNIKTACLIAKTVIAAKENESVFLTKQLNEAKNEVNIMSEKNKKYEDKFKQLSNTYQTTFEEMERLRGFIGMGYKELQKIRKESYEDVPVLVQLKTIIDCCGQYYAEYCNEHEKCQQLEQKVRFLNSKISFLKSTINNNMHEITAGSRQNAKLLKENRSFLNGFIHVKKGSNTPVITFSQSDHRMSPTVNHLTCTPYKSKELTSIDEIEDEYVGDCSLQNFDLNNHFCLVKNLLRDQGCMLLELKTISQELNSDLFDN